MAIRRRIRPDSTFLPEFILANICRENARLDKFQIKFPNFNVTCRSNDRFKDVIEGLRRSLLFCGGGADNKLKLRKKARGQDRDWLVSGIGSIPFVQSGSTYTFPAHFSINFNEFWTCNTHRFDDDALNSYDAWGDTPTLNGTELYQADDARLRTVSTRTLNQKNNALFGSDWERTYNVSHCFLLQVHALVDLLQAQLRPFGARNVRLNTNDAVLTQAEVCFDFYEPDALTRINTLIPHIKHIAQQGSFKDFKVTRDKNALGCVIIAKDNVTIAIYAKTAQRIRCEVRYTKSLRTVLGRDAPRRKHDNSLESLCEVVEAAIADATDRLRRVLQELERVREPEAFNPPSALASLMHELSIATENNKLLSTLILTQLINNGNITVNQRTKEAIKILHNRGVLYKPKVVKRAAKAYYRVSNSYLPLFEALRAINK